MKSITPPPPRTRRTVCRRAKYSTFQVCTVGSPPASPVLRSRSTTSDPEGRQLAEQSAFHTASGRCWWRCNVYASDHLPYARRNPKPVDARRVLTQRIAYFASVPTLDQHFAHCAINLQNARHDYPVLRGHQITSCVSVTTLAV